MKIFKILSHPYTLIICFSLILISGEQWGGFYAFYILIALPYGGVHALLAIAGILAVLISFHWTNNQTLKQILNIVGVFFLFTSLYYFFDNDRQHYNWGTFQEPVSLLTIIIASCVAICFLATTLITKTRKNISIV